MPKKVDTERLKRSDLEIIDFIVAHPEMSETACVIACGWTKGGSGKIMQRIRPQLDARLKKNSASVDKLVVKAFAKFDAIEELAEMATSWRGSKYGVTAAHVRAAELYAHLSGQTPEAKKIFAEVMSKAPAGTAADADPLYRSAWAGQEPRPN